MGAHGETPRRTPSSVPPSACGLRVMPPRRRNEKLRSRASGMGLLHAGSGQPRCESSQHRQATGGRAPRRAPHRRATGRSTPTDTRAGSAAPGPQATTKAAPRAGAAVAPAPGAAPVHQQGRQGGGLGRRLGSPQRAAPGAAHRQTGPRPRAAATAGRPGGAENARAEAAAPGTAGAAGLRASCRAGRAGGCGARGLEHPDRGQRRRGRPQAVRERRVPAGLRGGRPEPPDAEAGPYPPQRAGVRTPAAAVAGRAGDELAGHVAERRRGEARLDTRDSAAARSRAAPPPGAPPRAPRRPGRVRAREATAARPRRPRPPAGRGGAVAPPMTSPASRTYSQGPRRRPGRPAARAATSRAGSRRSAGRSPTAPRWRRRRAGPPATCRSRPPERRRPGDSRVRRCRSPGGSRPGARRRDKAISTTSPARGGTGAGPGRAATAPRGREGVGRARSSNGTPSPSGAAGTRVEVDRGPGAASRAADAGPGSGSALSRPRGPGRSGVGAGIAPTGRSRDSARAGGAGPRPAPTWARERRATASTRWALTASPVDGSPAAQVATRAVRRSCRAGAIVPSARRRDARDGQPASSRAPPAGWAGLRTAADEPRLEEIRWGRSAGSPSPGRAQGDPSAAPHAPTSSSAPSWPIRGICPGPG